MSSKKSTTVAKPKKDAAKAVVAKDVEEVEEVAEATPAEAVAKPKRASRRRSVAESSDSEVETSAPEDSGVEASEVSDVEAPVAVETATKPARKPRASKSPKEKTAKPAAKPAAKAAAKPGKKPAKPKGVKSAETVPTFVTMVAPVPTPKKSKVAAKRRTIKMGPSAVDDRGLGISGTRVKRLIINIATNKAECDAIAEIKASEVHDKKNKTVKVVKELKDLSPQTLKMIEIAKREYDAMKRKKHIASNLKKLLSDKEREIYNEKLSALRAKLSVENAKKTELDEDDDEVDVKNASKSKSKNAKCVNVAIQSDLEEKIILGIKPDFFSGMKPTGPKPASPKHTTPETEAAFACRLISKMRIRFSKLARLEISAFVEYIARQIISSGLTSAAVGSKRMVKIVDVISDQSGEVLKPWIKQQFTFYPFITSFKAFDNNITKIKQMEQSKLDKEKSKSEADAKSESKKEVKVADKEINKDQPEYQFKCYINELIRGVRNEVVARYKDSDEPMALNLASLSVSTEFKSFCTEAVTELIMRIGVMLKNEVVLKQVKTINIEIAKTIIKQIHTILGVPYEPTEEFINTILKKFDEYSAAKRVKNPKSKASKNKKSTEAAADSVQAESAAKVVAADEVKPVEAPVAVKPVEVAAKPAESVAAKPKAKPAAKKAK